MKGEKQEGGNEGGGEGKEQKKRVGSGAEVFLSELCVGSRASSDAVGFCVLPDHQQERQAVVL